MIGDFRAEQLGLVVAASMGAKPTWTTLAERLEKFEAALAQEPPRLDPEEQELRMALGLKVG